MSISALIVGRLIADPERRTGSNGKPFVTARMLASPDGDEAVFCSLIAFGLAADALAALAKGDTAAVVGRTRPKCWTKDGETKVGLDVVVEHLISLYHLKRKRAAIAAEGDA